MEMSNIYSTYYVQVAYHTLAHLILQWSEADVIWLQSNHWTENLIHLLFHWLLITIQCGMQVNLKFSNVVESNSQQGATWAFKPSMSNWAAFPYNEQHYLGDKKKNKQTKTWTGTTHPKFYKIPLLFFNNARSFTSVEIKHIRFISRDMNYLRSSDKSNNNALIHLITHSLEEEIEMQF